MAINNKKYFLASIIAALVCFVAAGVLGWDIRQRFLTDQLWGQRVLWFWLFVWTGILLLLGRFITTLPQGNRLLIASLTSGVLLAGGFMPWSTFFLMFIAFVPLLWVEEVLSQEREGTSLWTLFKFSFCTFLTWNLLSTYWIQNSSFVAGIFSNALNSVFMCVPILLYHLTKKRMGQRAAAWGFVGYWMTFEIGHLNWDLSWPWLTLGNSFAHLPAIIQWYEFTGVFGGTLWILVLNIYVAVQINKLYTSGRITTQALQPVFLRLALGIAIPIAVSLIRYYTYNVATDRQVEVVTVQPNYEPHYQKFRTPQKEQVKHFQRLSAEKITQNTDYLVFPETVFNGIEITNIKQHPLITGFRSFIKDYPKINLVMGLSSFKEYEEAEKKPHHLYTICNEDKTFCRYIDSHNSSIQLNNQTDEIPYYKKSKLVPGAESMPFIGNVDFFRSLILDLGGAPGLSLGKQKEREVFSSKSGAIGTLICYESVYGDYVTEYTRKGAEAFFVITNDGWWDNTLGHRQHMYMSSLRAIENRRYVVRSANTGISCYVNSRGDIYNPSKYNEAIALRDDIYMNDKMTIYARYGDLIGRVSILITLWLIVTMIANGLKREKKKKT